jgi:hypothetical protein
MHHHHVFRLSISFLNLPSGKSRFNKVALKALQNMLQNVKRDCLSALQTSAVAFVTMLMHNLQQRVLLRNVQSLKFNSKPMLHPLNMLKWIKAMMTTSLPYRPFCAVKQINF